jgi:ankyrin repeat protein
MDNYYLTFVFTFLIMLATLAFWRRNKPDQARLSTLQRDLITAIKNSELDRVKEILEGGSQLASTTSYQGHGLLIFACVSGDPAVVKYLIDQGCDVNGVSKVRPR